MIVGLAQSQKKRFRIPRHGSQELAKGTKGSIEKLSGVKL
jgi:hypothetical protein